MPQKKTYPYNEAVTGPLTYDEIITLHKNIVAAPSDIEVRNSIIERMLINYEEVGVTRDHLIEALILCEQGKITPI
jgi:hypothetical protein